MFATTNGVQSAFTDAGEGLPLVFIHGFPLSRGAWSRQVDAFQPKYRVIAPDLRGFGESGASSGPVIMSRYAEDIHALLLHLGTGPVILMGHSMGGYVAMAFAKAFPDLLRGLVLVGTKAGGDAPEVAAARRATAEKVRKEGIASVVESMAPKMLSAVNTDAGMAQSVRDLMRPASQDGVIGALLGMAERPDAGAWIGKIRVPTLVVAGADDILILPSESQSLAKAIPDAHLTLIPRAGHLVAFEQPEAFNEALSAWLTWGTREPPADRANLAATRPVRRPVDTTTPTGGTT
jgi:pimeloyl-ACP methyl ester carboxylesterase